MSRPISYHLGMMIFVTIIIVSNSAAISAQTDTVSFPEFIVEDTDFSTNNHNDLYLQSEAYHDFVPHSLKFSGDMARQTDFIGDSAPDNRGSRTANTAFSDDQPGIMQFLNGTSEEQTLTYRRNYFSLLKTDDGKSGIFAGPKQVLLTANNVYVFSIDVTDLKPIFLHILVTKVEGTGAGNTFTLSTSVLDTGGKGFSTDLQIVQDIDEYIPFYPKQEGNYIFTISPNKNIVVDEFSIEDSPKVEKASRSFGEEYKGSSTIAKFIKISATSGSSLWDLSSIVYQGEYLVDAVTYVKPGSIRFQLFTANTVSPFGTAMASVNTQVYTDSDIYVAVIVTPPNLKDPDMRKAKDDGIIDGIDIEMLLSAQSYDIDRLPVDTIFETIVERSYELSGSKYYTFTPTERTLLGVNSSTSTSSISFKPLHMGMEQVNMAPSTYNAKFDPRDNVAIFEPGPYLVELPVDNQFLFSRIDYQVLNSSVSLNETIGDTSFFYLPSSEYSRELLNFTYLDHLNQSTTYAINFLDASGANVEEISGGGAHTFSHYYDNSTGLFEVDNNTEFTSTFLSRNLNGMYLRVQQIGNSAYNRTGHEVLTDDLSVYSSLKIDRENYFRVQDTDLSNNQYYFSELGLNGTVTHNLNGSISDIRDFVTFNTQEGSAYRLSIETTNRTVSGLVFTPYNSGSWTSNVIISSNSMNVSGIIHNYYEIEFASDLELKFGIQVLYQNLAVNATTLISLSEVQVQHFPSLQIDSLSDETQIGGGIDLRRTISLAAIAIGGVTIVALMVYFIRKRLRKV